MRSTIASLFATATAQHGPGGVDKSPQAEMSAIGDIGTKIVGGDPVNHCNYEFMAALLYSDGSSWWGCGAALIAPNKILTAAHCVEGEDASSLNVVIGTNNLDNFKNCSKSEVINVVEVDVHQDYDGGSMDYDLAILTLARDSNLKPAKYVCDVSHADDQSVMVAGFGTTSSGGSVSSQLLEVEVTTNTNKICKPNYGSDMILDSMFCASDQGPNQDSCQGDSGGPVFKFDDSKKEAIHHGVVSWGYGCAETMYPGVYAKTNADNAFMAKHDIPGASDCGQDNPDDPDSSEDPTTTKDPFPEPSFEPTEEPDWDSDDYPPAEPSFEPTEQPDSGDWPGDSDDYPEPEPPMYESICDIARFPKSLKKMKNICKALKGVYQEEDDLCQDLFTASISYCCQFSCEALKGKKLCKLHDGRCEWNKKTKCTTIEQEYPGDDDDYPY